MRTKSVRTVLLLTIFIIWIVVSYLIAREQMNGFLIAGMGLLIIPQTLRDMKPDLRRGNNEAAYPPLLALS